MTNKKNTGEFRNVYDDTKTPKPETGTPQTRSFSYRLAYADPFFLLRDELRPVRLQLELLKTDLLLKEKGIHSTIVVFGSARISDRESALKEYEEAEAEARKSPADKACIHMAEVARKKLEKSKYYEEARNFARMVSSASKGSKKHKYIVITGGGPGIMEGANRGAHDIGAINIGLNIVLPTEQTPNPYITPELSFQFQYFAIRKMHFLMRARALVIFPGGFGTLDELFDALTLIQTKKITPIPVLLFGEEYWRRIINFEAMVEEGMIDPEDSKIIQYVETAEDACRIIMEFYEKP